MIDLASTLDEVLKKCVKFVLDASKCKKTLLK